MNYIEQINGFWNKSEISDLTGIDVAVYMALLKYCNRLNWLNPFVCHWDIVCQTSKVSKNAYYKSLDRLNEFGFIKSEKGVKNTNIKPKIFILELTNSTGTVKEQRGNKEGIDEEQTGNLYKHLTNKQINIILNHFDSLPPDELKDKLYELQNKKPIKVDEIDFDKLLQLINHCTGKNLRIINGNTKKKFIDRLKEGYSKEDISRTIKNASKDSFHVENNFKWLTPEYFSRAATIDKFSSPLSESPKQQKQLPAGVWNV